MGALLLTPWLMGALACDGGAGAKPAPPGVVRVCVVVILASDKHTDVDRQLTCIAREVKKQEERLSILPVGLVGSATAMAGGCGSGPLLAAATAIHPRPRLTGFRQKRFTEQWVRLDKSQTFELCNSQKAVIEVHQCQLHPKRLCIKVKAPNLGTITYTSVCGKYFPLITGYQTKKGDRLIIAIMACREAR